jgi:hypothetical protein
VALRSSRQATETSPFITFPFPENFFISDQSSLLWLGTINVEVRMSRSGESACAGNILM